MSGKKKICIISSTRADWGLLSPIAHSLNSEEDLDVTVIATNMHLMARYGMTVDEIIADGFTPVKVILNQMNSDDELSRVKLLSDCISKIGEKFAELKPDAVLILGDRFEILGVASAAALMNIPIIHIAGGEISEGAMDDSFRHAITKLSTLHLTATEPYRKRVVQLGEMPSNVINTGAIGVWNTLHFEAMPFEELQKFIGLDLRTHPLAVVTYHPATLDNCEKPINRIKELLKALAKFPEMHCVITYPNNDAHSEGIIQEIKSFAQGRRNISVHKSLGMRGYLSLLRVADVCIGNSSSGIVEVPSFGIPTVDIGIRQRGRVAAESVIHCGDSEQEIISAIKKALSPEFQNKCKNAKNPYYQSDSLEKILGAIKSFMFDLPVEPKKFYDL